MDYFETGFAVRERSWHGKELLLAEHPADWDEARRAAGLLWEPRAVEVFKKVTTTRPATFAEQVADPDQTSVYWDRMRCQWSIDTVEYVEATTGKVIERDDTGAELAVVGKGFELISHAEMGQIMETVLELPNVKIDTAGSVKGGRQVYATVLLDEPYQIRGDLDGFGDPVTSLPYFVILNSHDGTGACKGLYSQVRVVCANTYQAASIDGDRHGAQFSLRHTSGVKNRIEEARSIIEGARTEAARWKEIAEGLALLPISGEQELRFLNEFIPAPPAGTTSDRVVSNIERDRAAFMGLLESSTNSGMRGNGLCLVNAAVEYLDHVRGFRNAESYMGRQLLRPEPLKARAVKLVRELAGASV